MTMPHVVALDPARSLSLPEYRQLELYSKKKELAFAADPEAEQAEAERTVTRLARVFATLDAALGDPLTDPDPMAVWRKYLALPKAGGPAKLMAEIYRTLRLFHAAATHPTGRVDVRNGLIKAHSVVERTALTIRVSRVGARLLESAVAYWLEARDSPYPPAYVEAMLCRYWADITGELHWYYDEDQRLYQFHDRLGFNRHFRYDCDNPKMELSNGVCRIQIGDRYRDPARYPIDFFIVVTDLLYIVPAEAMLNYTIELAEMDRWRARLPDGLTLPSAFRARFGREVMIPGLPMT